MTCPLNGKSKSFNRNPTCLDAGMNYWFAALAGLFFSSYKTVLLKFRKIFLVFQENQEKNDCYFENNIYNINITEYAVTIYS